MLILIDDGRERTDGRTEPTKSWVYHEQGMKVFLMTTNERVSVFILFLFLLPSSILSEGTWNIPHLDTRKDDFAFCSSCWPIALGRFLATRSAYIDVVVLSSCVYRYFRPYESFSGRVLLDVFVELDRDNDVAITPSPGNTNVRYNKRVHVVE